jgi:glucose-1-phosphate adenylyltransferase
MLEKQKKIVAYPFDGYWRDVGTIQSYWEANMDLLEDGQAQSLLQNDSLKIFTEDTRSLPQYVGDHALIKDSLVNQGAIIFGTVEHSIIFHDVVIEEGAIVKDSVIMPGAIVKKDVILERTVVAPQFKVEKHVKGNQDIVLVNK